MPEQLLRKQVAVVADATLLGQATPLRRSGSRRFAGLTAPPARTAAA